jgi:RNase P/RNase MRP subunit POP5
MTKLSQRHLAMEQSTVEEVLQKFWSGVRGTMTPKHQDSAVTDDRIQVTVCGAKSLHTGGNTFNREFMWLWVTRHIFYVNRNRSNVQSVSTALSTVPGTMSSHSRQRFPLYQVQYRVSPDSALRCTRHNVESVSTALSTVPGPISSHSRQLFPLNQAQCRVSLDSAFHCTRSNGESVWTALSAVRNRMSSSNRHVIVHRPDCRDSQK